MKIPEFILRKLYVRGSLRNTANGFEFKLKNALGSGYAIQLLPLRVDGNEIAIKTTCFYIDQKIIPFMDINEDNPFTLVMNKDIKITVQGDQLKDYDHKIRMGFIVKGLGTLEFDFTDRAL